MFRFAYSRSSAASIGTRGRVTARFGTRGTDSAAGWLECLDVSPMLQRLNHTLTGGRTSTWQSPALPSPDTCEKSGAHALAFLETDGERVTYCRVCSWTLVSAR